jgi:hypothetical protein
MWKFDGRQTHPRPLPYHLPARGAQAGGGEEARLPPLARGRPRRGLTAAGFRRQMSGDRRQKFLRRFAPEVYVSGFRVKPGMTTQFFASPGVGFGVARRGLWGRSAKSPSACALHADRRANTVRPYIARRRPAGGQRPAERRRPAGEHSSPLHCETTPGGRTAPGGKASPGGRTQFAPTLRDSARREDNARRKGGARRSIRVSHISPFTFHRFSPSPFSLPPSHSRFTFHVSHFTFHLSHSTVFPLPRID